MHDYIKESIIIYQDAIAQTATSQAARRIRKFPWADNPDYKNLKGMRLVYAHLCPFKFTLTYFLRLVTSHFRASCRAQLSFHRQLNHTDGKFALYNGCNLIAAVTILDLVQTPPYLA